MDDYSMPRHSHLALMSYLDLVVDPDKDAIPIKLKSSSAEELDAIEMLKSKGVTESYAAEITTRWTVVDQIHRDSGLSATVFEEKATGQRYLAVRGTDSAMDWVTNVVHVGGVGHAGFSTQFRHLENQVRAWLDDGVLSPGFNVAGHSLGGFLSAELAREFQGQVGTAYIYDAPGVEGVEVGLASTIEGALDILLGREPGAAYAQADIVNVVAQHDWVNRFGEHVAPEVTVNVEPWGPMAGHSMGALATSLLVYETFAQAAPGVETSTLNEVFAASKNENNRSLGAMLGALEDLYGGSGSGDLGGRALELQGRIAQSATTGRVELLAGLSASELAAKAREDIAYRHALVTASPFVLLGAESLLDGREGLSLFDPATGAGSLTDEYLSDRARYLSGIIARNTSALGVLPGEGTAYWDSEAGSAWTPDVGTPLLPAEQADWIKFGGAAGERLLGANGEDRIYAGGGADDVSAGGGADRVEGGSGDDVLRGEAGNDRLEGMAGKDRMEGGIGNDLLRGGAGNDRLYGGGDDDELFGGQGSDTLFGGAMNDHLRGGADNDVLNGEEGSDTYLFGLGDGNDTIRNFDPEKEHRDVLRFDAGIGAGDVKIERGGYQDRDLIITVVPTNERITVSSHFYGDGQYALDAIEFGDGVVWSADDIRAVTQQGSGENDVIEGFDGDDIQLGFAGQDRLYGRGGEDEQHGGLGADRIYGDAGNDRLFGGEGRDTLYGGAGNDELRAGPGAGDYMNAGAGNDTYIVTPGEGSKRIYNYDPGAAHIDVLRFEGGIAAADVQMKRGGRYNLDLLITLPATGEVITVERFFGGDRYALDGVEFADGTRLGSDAKTMAESQLSDADGTRLGVDEVRAATQIGTEASESIEGFGGADLQQGLGGNDTLRGESGDDEQHGGLGADRIHGDAGNDRLFGGEGRDTLYGGAGNDELRAGPGAGDYMNAGAGNDTYIVTPGEGNKRIYNYDSNAAKEDTLRFAGGIGAGDLWFARRQDDLEITMLESGDTVTLSRWYRSTVHQIERIETGEVLLVRDQVEMLVSAMASYDVPAGAGSVVPQDVKDQLDPILAETWQAMAG